MPLMTNAEAFEYDFGFYATELWAMPEAQFLEWLNSPCDRERPIDAVPVKHGKWMKTGQSFVNPNKFRNYWCSACGYDIEKRKYNYCPNCGASMDVRKDDE